MRIKINVLLNFKGHEGIDISRQESKTVVAVKRSDFSKFIRSSSALEAKGFKNAEGGVNRQAVYIHNPGLLYDVMRIIAFVYCYGNAVRSICNLRYGIYNKAVIFFAVI